MPSRTLFKSAHNGGCKIFRFTIDNTTLPLDFLNQLLSLLQSTIDEFAGASWKVNPVISVHMQQLDAAGNIIKEDDFIFSTSAQPIHSVILEDIISGILGNIFTFTNNGSNWVVVNTNWFDLRISKYDTAPQYRGHGTQTPMPKRLQAKKACVNVCNGGGVNCFQYAILSILHYNDASINTNHRAYSNQYHQFINLYKWRPELFPMCASNIHTFEQDNPGIRINLLHWDESNAENPIRALYLTSGKIQATDKLIILIAYDLPNAPSHYVGVVNFNRLFSSRNKQERHRCERCLRPFNSNRGAEKDLAYFNQHRLDCYSDTRTPTLPPKDSSTYFTKWANMQRLSYIVYADIECILEKTDGVLAKHVPAVFGFLLVPSPELKKTPLPMQYYHFVGPSCILDGMRKLEEVARQVYSWIAENSDCPLQLTSDEWREYHTSTRCFLCREYFGEGLKRKVREHDHLSGRYRGAACQDCNNKARLRKNLLPVFFHNLKNYDAHHVCVQALGQLKHWSISVIPLTSEKYISISCKFEVEKTVQGAKKMEICLKDSYQFLTASLATLVGNIPKEELEICKTLPWSMHIISEKGIFPYSFFDAFNKFEYPVLPAASYFYDELTKSDISTDDYERAKSAWEEMECRNFGDYVCNYLQMDVYQLADVFEKFRSLSLCQDNLDPAYYPTLPSMSWDLSFKFTHARVDLLSDVDMYDFFTNGIRGGMTFVNIHHLTANTPSIPDLYDSSKPTSELLYVDANNLYGHALSMKLPKCDFVWLEEDEMYALQSSLSLKDLDGDVGYYLEVDLDYPPQVQDLTEDLPLAPEKAVVTDEMLTEFMKNQWRDVCELRGTPGRRYHGTSKLLLTHWKKEKYCVHGKLLEFYLNMGMRLIKIYRGIKFQQEAFFEPYISSNSACRQAAKNDFEKDYYKLKNNSLFGKTMENVARRKNFRLVNNGEDMKKLSSRAEFLESYIFNEDLTGALLAKENIVLDKPIFIGQAVLDLSKLVMYKLRYEKFPLYEQKFGGRIRIAGGDTDSFFLKVEGMGQNLLPAMLQDGLLDSSNYPSTHPFYSTKFKAKLGCIKDESCGEVFKEWVLLRPKCYSMLTVGGSSKTRAKGVQRSVVKKEITFNDYKHAYLQNTELYHVQRRFQSSNHIIHTIEFVKRSLSFFEDKRTWISSNTSLPYGNHKLSHTSRPQKRSANVPILYVPAEKRLCV